MTAKKGPKIVQITPQGAMLWDTPEPVRLVSPSPFGPFGQQRQRLGPSPAHLARLRRRYRSPYLHWHKRFERSNAAGKFVAALEDEQEDRPETPPGHP
jgi:hypothetical protein